MLFYFILGILFISLGIPLLENIESIISSYTEYIVYILAYKIYTLKEKMKEEKEEQEQEFQIGFRQTQIKEIKPKEKTSQL